MLKRVNNGTDKGSLELHLVKAYKQLYNVILASDEKDLPSFIPFVSETVKDMEDKVCQTEGVQFIASDADILYPLLTESIRKNGSFQMLLHLYLSTFKEYGVEHVMPSEETLEMIKTDCGWESKLNLK